MLALKGIKGGFNPFAVGAAYLFLSAAWWLPSPWQVIGFLNFFPLIPLVKALNEYHQLDEKIPPNNSFAWWQWIFIFLGACLTLLTVVANFL